MRLSGTNKLFISLEHYHSEFGCARFITTPHVVDSKQMCHVILVEILWDTFTFVCSRLDVFVLVLVGCVVFAAGWKPHHQGSNLDLISSRYCSRGVLATAGTRVCNHRVLVCNGPAKSSQRISLSCFMFYESVDIVDIINAIGMIKADLPASIPEIDYNPCLGRNPTCQTLFVGS